MKRTISTHHSYHNRTLVALLCMMLLITSGCTRYNYTVEMSPAQDGKMARSIHLQSTKGRFQGQDEAEIKRLAASYGAEVPIGADVAVSFAGTFNETMPQDVGGAGNYSHWNSPLGSVEIYAERFRGNDDLDTLLRVRRQTVDQLADLIVGWFESELHNDPQWPTLHAFLDHQFRNDLQNFSLLALALNGVWGWQLEKLDNAESVEVEIGLRAAHYAVERGYVSYDKFPALARAVEDAIQKDDFTGILSHIRMIVIRRMGERGQFENTTRPHFLMSSQSVSDSWKRYFTTTDYFQQQGEDFDKHHEHELPQAGKEREQMRVLGMTAELLQVALSPWGDHNPTANHDNLNLALSVENSPSWTNGEWNPDRQQIEWSRTLPTTDELPALASWPAFCYAIWAEPDHAAQTRLFGKVTLSDKKLFAYTLWYAGLTSSEQQQWDAFVSTLQPSEEWTAPLSKFRFSDEPEGINPGDRRASSAINLLEQAHAATGAKREK